MERRINNKKELRGKHGMNNMNNLTVEIKLPGSALDNLVSTLEDYDYRIKYRPAHRAGYQYYNSRGNGFGDF